MAEKTKQYRISVKHYREGVMYPAGSVVTVPADAKPSSTWAPVEEKKADVKAEEPKPKAQNRASDRDVA